MMRSEILICYLMIYCVTGNITNEYCQLKCKEGLHTVCDRKERKCGPDLKCGPGFREIKLDDNKRQAILDLHNELRNKVALGQEGRQPSATNMMALSYNKELEFIAQCWVNSCNGSPLRHDVCRKTSDFRYVGQNLGIQSNTNSKLEVSRIIENLIQSWYEEVNSYNPDSVLKGTYYHGTGHYTQMVWANTTEMGCAVSYYTTLKDGRKWHHHLLACNYGPGGNYRNTPVYRVGAATSECPQGKMNAKYKGLCGIDRKLRETAEFMGFFEGQSSGVLLNNFPGYLVVVTFITGYLIY